MRLAPVFPALEKTMNREDILLVQQSWHAVEPVKQVAAELFYVKLFELDPALGEVFGDDLAARREKFLQLLSATVRALDRSDVLLAAVRELGIRHPLFGRHDHHHVSVAGALLWTLQKCLRKDFTQPTRCAWIRVYGVLSQAMRRNPHVEVQQVAA
jgi:hemoglobin-like flavoprotein